MPLTGLTLGPGLLLARIEDIWREFEPFGWKSVKSFRYFLRALSVPTLETPDGQILVHVQSLQLSLAAITRVGVPDFLAPGSTPITKGSKPTQRATATAPSPSREAWSHTIAHLVACARLDLHNKNIQASLRAAYTSATERIITAIETLHGQALSTHQRASLARAAEVLQDCDELFASLPCAQETDAPPYRKNPDGTIRPPSPRARRLFRRPSTTK